MLITFDQEKLRTKCEDVLPHEVDDLIAILEKELDECNRLGKNGIGLAAPQIGIAKNIAIIRMDKLKTCDINLINCKIDKFYDPVSFKGEGCLSFPGVSKDTLRYQEIHITNNLVHPHSFIATGFFAIACQHEIDHLNGTLFMDHEEIINPINISSPKPKTKNKPNEPCLCGSNKKYKKCCGES